MPSTTVSNINAPQSSSCGCLTSLQTVEMAPARYSQGRASVTSLRRIDAVRIDSFVKRNGTLFYVIDVFLQRPESRIPTTIRDTKRQQQQHKQYELMPSDTATTAASRRQPDFQVERCFSEFAKLRSKLYKQAQTSHSMLRCSFCDAIVNSTLLSAHQPKRFMNVLFTRNVLAKVLTKYLSHLLAITLRSKKNNGCRACTGQEQIPQLVLAFLRQPEAQATL